MKWIRWKGLIAFIVIIGIFAGIWFAFADIFVERMIEKNGTRMNGAKVELDGADISLFPAGLTLTRLQVANPDEPMKNALEIKSINLKLDSLNLLRRKVIVEDMTVDGIELGTPRKSSGAIGRRHSAVKEAVRRTVCRDFEFSLPSFDVPDVKDILSKEKLESLEAVKSLKSEINKEKDRWKKQLESLPNKEKFEEYRKKIEKLTASSKGGLSGILGSVNELKKVQEDLKRDLESIKTARKGLKEEIKSLKSRIDKISKEPLKDIQRLKEKYFISPKGLEGLSEKLLSTRLCAWVEKARAWYDRIKPVLERARQAKEGGKGNTKGKGETEVIKPLRAKGFDVRFKEYAPMPDFLIKTADASANLAFGDINGRLNNITPDQDVLGAPLTFKFSGASLKGVDSVDITGELNHIDAASPKDTVSVRIGGYRLNNITLSENKALPLVLKDGIANLNIKVSLKGDSIDSKILAGFKSVKLSSAIEKGSNQLANILVSSLSSVRELKIRANISGTIEKYEIKVSSNLDKVLKDAIGKQVKEQAAGFEKRLKAQVMAKVNGPMGELKGNLGGFDAIGGELSGRLNSGSGALNDILKKGSKKKGVFNGIKLPF